MERVIEGDLDPENEPDEKEAGGQRGLSLTDLTERQTNVPHRMNTNRDWNESYSSENQYEDADLKLGRLGDDVVALDAVVRVTGQRAVVEHDLEPQRDHRGREVRRGHDRRLGRAGVVEQEVHDGLVDVGSGRRVGHGLIITSPNKYVKKKAEEHTPPEERPPWVAVDLDGTILEDPQAEDYEAMEQLVRETGEQQQPILKDPLQGAAEALNELMSLGFRVSIFTARFADDLDPDTMARFRDEIERHLEAHGIPFSDIWIGQKPRADHYIDNKAVEFDGDWEAVLSQVTVLDEDGAQGEEEAVELLDEEEMEREGVALIDSIDDEFGNGFLDTDQTRRDRSIPRPRGPWR
jgi:hypothetical protein